MLLKIIGYEHGVERGTICTTGQQSVCIKAGDTYSPVFNNTLTLPTLKNSASFAVWLKAVIFKMLAVQIGMICRLPHVLRSLYKICQLLS